MNALFNLVLTFALVLSDRGASHHDVFELNRCGPFAIQMCALAVGKSTSQREIDALVPPGGEEATLEHLDSASKALGLFTLPVTWRGTVPDIDHSPAIIPVINRDGKRHFITMLRVRGGLAQIVDFPGHPIWVPIQSLRDQLGWEGIALHVARDDAGLSAVRSGLAGSITPTRCALIVAGFGCFVVAGWRAIQAARRKPRPPISRLQPPIGNARSGMTIVEVLVCLGILGIVISLILPALQGAREASRRLQCQSNLRQAMQACSNHQAALRRFPGTITGVAGAGGTQPRNLSAHFHILPFIDQQKLHALVNQDEEGFGATNDPPTSTRNAVAITTRVSVFECPSDSVPPGGTSYRICTGTGPSLHTTIPDDDGAAKSGAFSVFGKFDASISDGLSITIFFSEKLVGDRDKTRYTPWRDYFISGGGFIYPADAENGCRLPATMTNPIHGSYGGCAWLFSGYENTWYNHIRTPNSPSPDCEAGPGAGGAFTARSNHPGGANAVTGDGAVHFISDSIDLKVWRARSTSNGHEIVTKGF